jgi:hypothetical protein
MGYQLKPGGYADNQALADALRANEQAHDLVERILVDQPGRGLLYQYLAELGHALDDMFRALIRMKDIRRAITAEAPGLAPGASQTDDDPTKATTEPHYTTPRLKVQGRPSKKTQAR